MHDDVTPPPLPPLEQDSASETPPVEPKFIEPHEMPDTPVASEQPLDTPPPPIQEEHVSEAVNETLPPSGTQSENFRRINLNEKAPSLNHVTIAMGWDAPDKAESHDFDLDMCVFALNPADRVRQDGDFIFYNNLENDNKSIMHKGDDTDGRAEGDNEVIKIVLNELSFDIVRLVFTISIHNAEERNQTFKDVKSGFIRVVDEDQNQEIARFDLAHNNTEHPVIMFAELTRHDTGGWNFIELNQSDEKGLYGIASDCGVNVADPS